MTGTAGVAAVSELPEQLLDAIYYDTADLRLIHAGITLRRHTGGEDAGWHLKLPAGADTRDEIRLPLTGADDVVPEELTALVRAYTRGAALAPVVRIQIHRRVLRLLDSAGQALAEIAADHLSAGLRLAVRVPLHKPADDLDQALGDEPDADQHRQHRHRGGRNRDDHDPGDQADEPEEDPPAAPLSRPPGKRDRQRGQAMHDRAVQNRSSRVYGAYGHEQRVNIGGQCRCRLVVMGPEEAGRSIIRVMSP